MIASRQIYLAFITLITVLGFEVIQTTVNKSSPLTFHNSKYIIRSKIDLKGCAITVPKGCTLVFRNKGKIVNGTIVGDKTIIKSLRNACLGVIIEGTWNVPIIKDDFFDREQLTDNQILDNISSLQSDSVFNKVVLNYPRYTIDLYEGHKRALSLTSKTILVCNSTIQLSRNNLQMYSIIDITHKDHITIKGCRLIGDAGKHNYVEGSTSEWGFGIFVSKSTDVKIEKAYASKCTGDGIYIGGGIASELEDYSQASRNVIIMDSVCDDNRRQGISITYADGVVFKNCTFSNTGKTEFTSPGCGLDIEPNEGQSVRNVWIKSCRFFHNNRIMDISVGGYKTEGSKCNVESIVFDDCIITGTVSIRTGSLIMKGCSMKTLDIVSARMPKNTVLIEDCSISGGAGVTLSTVKSAKEEYQPIYVFRACKIESENVRGRALFNIIKNNGDGIMNFIVEDCDIVYPEGDQPFKTIPNQNNMSFYFRNCKIYPMGRKISLSHTVYSNCQIIE